MDTTSILLAGINYKKGIITYDAFVSEVEKYCNSQNSGKPFVSGSLPLSEDELWVEANRLYNTKEHSQDGRNLQMKHFTIARRQ